MTSKVIYLGELRTHAQHLRSGVELVTDAPPDNNGKGESFSPTDLTATSLANCMLTIAGIAARTHGINIDGTEAEVLKEMAANPRRISAVRVTVTVRGQEHYSDKEKSIIEHAARTCPVALSLHPDIEQDIKFNWP